MCVDLPSFRLPTITTSGAREVKVGDIELFEKSLGIFSEKTVRQESPKFGGSKEGTLPYKIYFLQEKLLCRLSTIFDQTLAI
jgi:hypothetical protein